MTDTPEQLAEDALPTCVERLPDRQGLALLRLRGPAGAAVEVCGQGAHVLSWRDAGGVERLFLSPLARFAPGVAIRGGVPVVFPQFSGRGVLPKHGLARGVPWQVRHASSDATSARVSFVLADDPGTRALWPHAFEARLDVVLEADALDLRLEVRNTGVAAFAFTAALHGYLAVDDLRAVRIHGLEGRPFEDAAGAGRWSVQGEDALRFDGELDRVYPEVPGPLVLEEAGRRMHLSSGGFPDVVVWNPGPALAAGLPDLGVGQHRHFVCVEAAAVIKPVVLGPGAAWQGWQRLRAL